MRRVAISTPRAADINRSAPDAPPAAKPHAASRDTGCMSGALAGSTILVADDQALLALDLAQTLRHAGAYVLEPAHGLAAAFELAAQHCRHLDVAVLEVTLEGKDVDPLTEQLTALDIPVLFYSSHPALAERALRFQRSQFLEKPSCPEAIMRALKDLIA